MTIKAAEAIDLSLTLFGGKDTSLKATDLPEGLSPDNNDVVYGPGFVASRPCASRLFAAPFAGNPRVVSEHVYLQPNQQPLNLFLDSLGVLHKEDVTNSPGTHSVLGNVVANSQMKAVSLDGFDFQVFSDGIHGIDIPRIYDGTNWDRLSQDGPATAPTAADKISTVAIAAANGIVADLAAVNVASASENGTLVTMVTATAHGLIPGNQISVVGVGIPYDGVLSIVSVPDATTITYIAAAGGAPVGAGGTIQGTRALVTTTTPHGMIGGAHFKIVGNSAAIYNNDGGTKPDTWTVESVRSATTFAFVCGTSPVVGINGTCTVGGQITVGPHQVCQAFLTRTGYITKPSPTVTWFAVGGRQVVVSNLAIGPANVVARILFFTGSNGGTFFWIPVAATGAMATIVGDNTSTSVSLDFADNTLFSASGIDIPGNNLFNLVTLAPCLGVDAYASRLFVWGEFNKVQNFLNMGFEGGTATVGGPNPLGWTIVTAGGALVTSPGAFGDAWQITGNGLAVDRGSISQTAYQNSVNQFILEPNTKYTFFCWAKASAAGLLGNLIATLSSASTGFTSSAVIAINTIPNSAGAFVSANFSLPTPAVIPSDLLITFAANSLDNLATLVVDEMMLVFTEQPYRDTLMRGSYVNNFQSFDGVTGDIGPESDPNPIIDTFQLLQQLSILTSERRHVTRDNSGEPGTWEVDQVETKCGAASVHSTTTGPNWAMWLADTGRSLALRITAGGESFKISREMKADFEAVNMNLKKNAWITNVDDESRVYIGLPQSEKNVTAVLDYFESDTAQDISFNRPLKIGFTGKMLTTDLGRKWTIWNIPLASGAVMPRPGGIKQFVGGSGTSLGLGPFGNAYIFDVNKFTDDDYGVMAPSYTTYFFINHEQELQLPVGSKNKYFSALTVFITGIGALQVQPIVNTPGNAVKNVINPAKPWALTTTLADDIELTGLDVKARRCAFKISVTPFGIPGGAGPVTDVQFVLSHLGITIQKHPVAPQSGVNRSSP